MPVTTPQGTLDFKKVDRVTFVGASSNTVIDTTTGSLGVGVGVGGPTSNLHVVGNALISSNLTVGESVETKNINMLHTSNTASIKLNSNVVAEFPRSKKLIKYPRVALTQNDESGTSGYVASAHSEYPDGTNYHAFRVFNNMGINIPYVAGVGWESANELTFGDNGMWGGPNASGATTSGSADTTMTLEEGNTIYGEWLQIQLPTKIRLEYVNFLILSGSAHAMAHRAPRAGYILGSNNGTNWTTLKNWSGITYDTWAAYYDTFYKFEIGKDIDYYQYFRFVWTETASGSGNPLSRYASCQELEFWGIPEYDPEAHGTDVTVKSVANVPNTDWLEVYYDGQDYTADTDFDQANEVLDKSGNNLHGSQTGGVGFDTDYKAFTFDGTTTRNITATLPSTVTGEYVHSISLWVKADEVSRSGSGMFTFFTIGSASATNMIALGVNLNSDGIKYDFFDASALVSSPPITSNEWMHFVVTYSGGANNLTGSKRIYLNGKELSVSYGGNSVSSPLSLPTSPTLTLGGQLNSSNPPFTGSIANFRLFNRVLTSDEIYQLYAYQKEDFGHGVLGMTLKAGRLGIGTSEPKAALDVRGDIHAVGSVNPVIGMWKQSIDSSAVTTNILTNIGSCVSTTTLNRRPSMTGAYGIFTAPYDGIYQFQAFLIGQSSVSACLLVWSVYGPSVDNNTWNSKNLIDSTPAREIFELRGDVDLEEPITFTTLLNMSKGDHVGIQNHSSGLLGNNDVRCSAFLLHRFN